MDGALGGRVLLREVLRSAGFHLPRRRPALHLPPDAWLHLQPARGGERVLELGGPARLTPGTWRCTRPGPRRVAADVRTLPEKPPSHRGRVRPVPGGGPVCRLPFLHQAQAGPVPEPRGAGRTGVVGSDV